MREIKFRAWDKEGKKWLDISYLFLDSEGKVIGYTVKGDTYTIDKVELVEYTGLKDKNGKEIYEGDIVKFRYYNKLVKGEVRDMSAHGLLIGMHFYWQMRQKDTTEVIGNIYENKELLE